MFDLLADALKLDEFLIALLGHFANEGAAKLTMTAVKAIGLAVVGFAVERREVPAGSKAERGRRRKRVRRRSPVKGTKPSRRGR